MFYLKPSGDQPADLPRLKNLTRRQGKSPFRPKDVSPDTSYVANQGLDKILAKDAERQVQLQKSAELDRNMAKQKGFDPKQPQASSATNPPTSSFVNKPLPSLASLARSIPPPLPKTAASPKAQQQDPALAGLPIFNQDNNDAFNTLPDVAKRPEDVVQKTALQKGFSALGQAGKKVATPVANIAKNLGSTVAQRVAQTKPVQAATGIAKGISRFAQPPAAFKQQQKLALPLAKSTGVDVTDDLPSGLVPSPQGVKPGEFYSKSPTLSAMSQSNYGRDMFAAKEPKWKVGQNVSVGAIKGLTVADYNKITRNI